MDEPMSIEAASHRVAAGAKAAFDYWESRGMDLAGYDIINMVDDLDDIRKAFGYERICLSGVSFGSQWSIAYMRRWPQHVDRALLGGVEPLDHGYDSAQGVWNVFQRLEEKLADYEDVKLPEEGLLGALKVIVERLEKKPVVVELPNPQNENYSARVTIGVDDFRRQIRASLGGSLRRSIETWPKFIVEIYNEQYDFLAAKTIEYRSKSSSTLMIATLADNSLGISAQREAKLKSEPARRWLGDLNWSYVASRDVTPTPTIDDEFRKFRRTEIPVLMVQGDLDIKTPIENAEELLEHLPNGHLIRIIGGTHSAMAEIAIADRNYMNLVVKFMNTDFGETKPQELFQTFPTKLEEPPLKMRATGGPTIYQQLIGKK